MGKKTKELREIIDKLNQKNSLSSIKDDKIVELELLIHKLRAESIRSEDVYLGQKGEVKKLKDKLEDV